ncbi:hypothetical protein HZH66_000192 [Vespula vulgaris]|uniref:Serine hydrolase domain-containing protein n=1 Tax=Vespula vulgaris TaxID=7454 RepID=A0A834KST8_VESVU|nr:hypothetical protein HZH66_000192 [Vespula vulgaris]
MKSEIIGFENFYNRICVINVVQDKLRILAIHGYHQSDIIFRGKLGSLRKGFKKELDFTFVRAPHKIPTKDEFDTDAEESGYGWWFNTEDRVFKATVQSNDCIGFEDSLDVIIKTCQEHGPFDGILGFSQGAAFAVILCIMQQRKICPFKFNFAIIISGFISLCAPHAEYYNEIIELPSLHIYGQNDKVVPNDMTEKVCDLFKNCSKIIHEGGHYIPSQKNVYKAFIMEMMEKKLH